MTTIFQFISKNQSNTDAGTRNTELDDDWTPMLALTLISSMTSDKSFYLSRTVFICETRRFTLTQTIQKMKLTCIAGLSGRVKTITFIKHRKKNLCDVGIVKIS